MSQHDLCNSDEWEIKLEYLWSKSTVIWEASTVASIIDSFWCFLRRRIYKFEYNGNRYSELRCHSSIILESQK
jgi:hypothetical protein